LRIVAALAALQFGKLALAQPIVLESAQLGTTGRIGGTSITTAQYPGWRFAVDEPLAVEQVGGHLLSYPSTPGDIFAAIVRLPSVDAMPAGAPFTAEEVVATTTFRPPFPSDEVLAPLSAALRPGAYALVFGVGLFGATGEGAIHNGPDQPDIPPTNISSYIFWGIPSLGEPPVWRTNLASNMRLVIEGQVINLPGDYNRDGDVDADDYELWRSEFGTSQNLAADGNGNGAIDAADYVIWRQHLGTSIEDAPGTMMIVPEPGTGALLCAAILSFAFARRYHREVG
jgi:hypothetical protein